ncbi:MAG: hypothetical protein ACRCZZ_10325, partial [Phocaeicola sp.]
TPNNKKWRLPTMIENRSFTLHFSRATPMDGYVGYYFGPDATIDGTGGDFLRSIASRVNDAIEFRTDEGYYWSSTVNTEKEGYVLSISELRTRTSLQEFGHAIRCVSR